MAASHDVNNGTMDIRDQEKTFDGFIRWSIRVSIASAIVVCIVLIAMNRT